MAKNTMYVSLSKSRGSNAISLDECINKLTQYKVDLNTKAKLFVQKLAEGGINIANLNLGYYGDKIIVGQKDESTGDEIIVTVYARDTEKVTSEWYHDGTVARMTISPTLMAEFGAGWLANVPTYPGTGNTPSGVGRGSLSFSAQGYGHANDSDWFWTKVSTNTTEHASEHVAEMTPTHPMYQAVSYMFSEANRIAREVFG